MEARLALHYFFFVLVYDLLYALIWLRGPFAARSMAVYAANMAERFWFRSEEVLAGIDPARLTQIQVGLSARPD